MRKFFGTDGVRGVANTELSPMIAYRIGRFIGQYPNGKKNRIIISRDTRISGDVLLNALITGILSSGSDVYYEGISTTPSISYLTNLLHFDYGIMISASHNPYYDNGIKLFNNFGEKISTELEAKIEEYIDLPNENLPFKENGELGRFHSDNSLLELYKSFLHEQAVKDFSELKVIVDCANGSASAVVPDLFRRLKVNAKYLSFEPNGTNINDRCGSTHLANICAEIVKTDYDLGLAFDGDADRLMVIDKKGRVIDGDMIVYLCAKHLKKENKLKDNAVVITVMSNIGLKNALSDLGIRTELTDVGDKYVQAKLKEQKLYLGGEQSGHIIFLDDLNTGDGILTAVKIMNILVATGKSVNELLEGLTIYPQLLRNVVAKNKKYILDHEGLQDYIKEKEKSLDGKGRILVRPSGTEPLVRVMCEAETDEICKSICEDIVNYIEDINM